MKKGKLKGERGTKEKIIAQEGFGGEGEREIYLKRNTMTKEKSKKVGRMVGEVVEREREEGMNEVGGKPDGPCQKIIGIMGRKW